MTGTILKGIGGFYYVEADGRVIECKAGGRLRLSDTVPLPGDRVELVPDGEENGLITAILPRKNKLSRPPAANIDNLFIVASTAPPVSDTCLIDKLTVLAIHNGMDPTVVLNKTDVSDNSALLRVYRSAGIRALETSAVTGLGIDELRALTAGKCSIFTGNSGVGKSSLLNALFPGYDMEVGEISRKIGRGKNTTRRVELFSLGNGGFIADSPGFSSLDIIKEDGIKKEDLQFLFPEIEPFFSKCRFSGCAHVKEPDCEVRRAVDKGDISKSRYLSYCRLYEQIKEFKDW